MKEEKTIILVTIQISTMSESKTIEYVLGYGNKNISYEDEEIYISNQTYDLSQVNLSYVNLFDKNNANILDMYIDSDTHQLTNTPTANRMKSIYISCSPSTEYTISKIASTKLVLGSFTATTANTVAEVYVSDINSLNNLTITTGANSQYLIVFLYDSETDITTTFDQIKNSLQIAKVNNYEIPLLLEGMDSLSNNISETKYISLPEPLREIENVVSDELDVANGQIKRYIDIEDNKAITLINPQIISNITFPTSDIIVRTDNIFYNI